MSTDSQITSAIIATANGIRAFGDMLDRSGSEICIESIAIAITVSSALDGSTFGVTELPAVSQLFEFSQLLSVTALFGSEELPVSLALLSSQDLPNSQDVTDCGDLSGFSNITDSHNRRNSVPHFASQDLLS
jgi:hypothetical protein